MTPTSPSRSKLATDSRIWFSFLSKMPGREGLVGIPHKTCQWQENCVGRNQPHTLGHSIIPASAATGTQQESAASRVQLSRIQLLRITSDLMDAGKSGPHSAWVTPRTWSQSLASVQIQLCNARPFPWGSQYVVACAIVTMSLWPRLDAPCDHVRPLTLARAVCTAEQTDRQDPGEMSRSQLLIANRHRLIKCCWIASPPMRQLCRVPWADCQLLPYDCPVVSGVMAQNLSVDGMLISCSTTACSSSVPERSFYEVC